MTDTTFWLCNEILREAIEVDFQNIMEEEDGSTAIEK